MNVRCFAVYSNYHSIRDGIPRHPSENIAQTNRLKRFDCAVPPRQNVGALQMPIEYESIMRPPRNFLVIIDVYICRDNVIVHVQIG
jgi:hypothetical protein